jgi:hypothetical protein
MFVEVAQVVGYLEVFRVDEHVGGEKGPAGGAGKGVEEFPSAR